MRFPTPLPLTSLPALARLHNVHFNGISIVPVPGLGLSVLFYPNKYDPTFPLLSVDRELVLCASAVELAAKSDVWVRDLITVCCGYEDEDEEDGSCEQEEPEGGALGFRGEGEVQRGLASAMAELALEFEIEDEGDNDGHEGLKKKKKIKVKPWGHNPRIMMLLFLVVMVARGVVNEESGSNPGVEQGGEGTKSSKAKKKHGIGVGSVWSEYVKLLRTVSIPTTWSDEERALLRGTSLEPAIDAKLSTLETEYLTFKALTSKISWCQEYLWGSAEPFTLTNWKAIDAWYRSRVLSLPGLGLCLIPFLDMVNHCALESNAYYSVDEDGDVVLLPSLEEEFSKERKLKRSDSHHPVEIRINYGLEKSSAELLFSYGFISPPRKVFHTPPTPLSTSLWLVLSLECPSDDPLKLAKEAVLKSAPTVRLFDFDEPDHVEWISEFIWLISANGEDGLEFKVARDVEGGRSLELVWAPPRSNSDVEAEEAAKSSSTGEVAGEDREDGEGEDESKKSSHVITNLASLPAYMEKSPLWPVYQLRATVTLSKRVEQQLKILEESVEADKLALVASEEAGDEGKINPNVYAMVQELKVRERGILLKAKRMFEKEKVNLVADPAVKKYLEGVAGSDEEDNGLSRSGESEKKVKEDDESEEDLA